MSQYFPRHIVLLFVSLLSQLLAWLFLHWTYSASFVWKATMTQPRALELTGYLLLGMVLFGLPTSIAGTFYLLQRSRFRVMIPMLLLCAIPALFNSLLASYTYFHQYL